MAVLISALGTAAVWAQATRWYISSGPGAGVVLDGIGNTINDPDWGAEGHVGSGPECECQHYHGVLFGEEDPNREGCGWGCIEQLPANADDARTTLVNAINSNTGTNTALRDKLINMINLANGAIESHCNSLFEGIMDAICSELEGALSNGQITDEQIDEMLPALVEFVVSGIDEIDPPFPPPPPPPKPCKVSLMLRRGSAGQTKLFDAKRKVNADVSEVVVLDVQGCPEGGGYEWEYKFKGAGKGEVPSRTGISFSDRRFCVIAEKPTSVTVTVTYHCPDGKMVKDTVTIVFQ